MSNEGPGISKIIKAINSTNRRDILRTLNFFKRPLSFTELMNEVGEKSASSSQFSYHLNVLADAGLIAKTRDNKYQLSALGNRTGLLLEMSQEDEHTAVFSSLYLAFSNMTPRDCLLATLIVPLVALMLSSVLYVFNPLLVIVTGLPLVALIYYLYTRLNSIIAMVFLLNFFWVMFVPGTLYLAPLFFLITFTVIPLVDPNAVPLPVPFNIILSSIFGIASLLLAIAYYIKFTGKE
ncbi:MAG: ArsR/SmtB family transcription factor [Candidatus Odinarchaeota archaeon]